MKKPYLLLAMFLLLFSCSKNTKYQVAGLRVQYIDLDSISELVAIRTVANDFSNIIDTISISELNESNSYTALIEFVDQSTDYILYIPNTLYFDTLTHISFERDSESGKIYNLDYQVNGKICSESIIQIKE